MLGNRDGCQFQSHLPPTSASVTHVDVGVEELCSGVAGQHVDDNHLPPLLHVNQEVAQLPVVLVDEVDALRANLLESHDDTSCHQLQRILNPTADNDVTLLFCNHILSSADVLLLNIIK